MNEPMLINKSQIKKENKKQGKPLKVELYRTLAEVMNHSPLIPKGRFPTFPHRFHLIEPDAGTRLILKEGAGEVVRIVPEDVVINALMTYAQVNELEICYQFATNNAAACVSYWMRTTPPKRVPSIFRWLDDPGLTYQRLPWKHGAFGYTPTWQELLERMNEEARAAFMAWVGSLFFLDSDRQQYLWLYGGGQNGKGAITRFLARVFGESFRSEQPPGREDKFWTYWLLGKRLVAFADCNYAAFPTTGLFKSLCGGDPVRMEIKGGASFTGSLDCKFLFSSNDRPGLSSSMADMRRAILVELEGIQGPPDPGYEGKLWDEGGAFLAMCMEVYEDLCPDHGRIPFDTTELEAHVSSLEEEFEVLFHREFDVPDYETRDSAFVSPEEMCRAMGFHYQRDARKIGEFKKYIERTYSVVRRRVQLDDGTRPYRYVGIRPKKYNITDS